MIKKVDGTHSNFEKAYPFPLRPHALIYNSPKTGYNEKANRPKEANVSKEPAETHPASRRT
jgi:hypothetical protein